MSNGKGPPSLIEDESLPTWANTAAAPSDEGAVAEACRSFDPESDCGLVIGEHFVR